MARFGDGLATGPDLLAAAESAARQAVDGLDGPPDLVTLFAGGDDPEAIGELGSRVARVTGGRHLIGCSAGGVIGAGRGVEGTRAVSVWAGVLPQVHVRSFHLEVMRTDAGLAVVGMPPRRDEDVAVVLLSDPWSFPAEGFVSGSNKALPGLPIVGGLASGGASAGATRLFLGERTYDRGAVGAVIGGAAAVRTVVSQGCRPVGPSMAVTRAEGNVLLELAGVPALTKLEQIVSALDPLDQALVTAGLHLGVAMDEYAEDHDRGDFLIRGLAGADRDRDGLVVGDVIEVGRTVRFQVRDADAADEDLRARLTAERAARGPADGALLFSCNGRGRALFTSADHDPALTRELLAPRGVGGFFAAGEIGPVGGRNHLHGFTASLLAFGPRR